MEKREMYRKRKENGGKGRKKEDIRQEKRDKEI
jgi:hypothetical protein